MVAHALIHNSSCRTQGIYENKRLNGIRYANQTLDKTSYCSYARPEQPGPIR